MRLVGMLAGALALAVVGSVTDADSWFPYGQKRFPDPTGRWYVVLKGSNRGADFTFAEARAGSEPVTVAHTKGFDDPKAEDGVRLRDRIHAKGTLVTAPLDVLVSTTGEGFAAMNEYGGLGYGNSFVWVTRAGEVRHVKRLADLFSAKEVEAFVHSVSSIHWFQSAWLDEREKRAVVVGRGNLVRVLDLVTGAVRRGGTDDVRSGLAQRDPAARTAALDILEDTMPPGIAAAVLPLYADEASPLAVRLRAAVVLARSGDLRGKELLRTVAASPGLPTATVEDRRYAVSHLSVVLGPDAIPILRELMRGPANDVWGDAQRSFAALGEAAVDTLLAMLAEKDGSPDYRGGAAHALREIKSPRSVKALLDAVSDPSEYVANGALNAAIAVAGSSISEELAALLDAGTTQDGRLASYFEEVREPASVGPLVRALRRHPKDEYPRSSILDALAFQTGAVLGDDTAAWEAWHAKRGR